MNPLVSGEGVMFPPLKGEGKKRDSSSPRCIGAPQNDIVAVIAGEGEQTQGIETVPNLRDCFVLPI